jgi:hypothetical protein
MALHEIIDVIDIQNWTNDEMREVAEIWLRARGWDHKHHNWPWIKRVPGQHMVRVSSFGHALEREMDWDIPRTYMSTD